MVFFYKSHKSTFDYDFTKEKIFTVLKNDAKCQLCFEGRLGRICPRIFHESKEELSQS